MTGTKRKSPMFLSDEEKATLRDEALSHIASGKSLKSFTDGRSLSYSMVWNILADEDNSITRARDIGTHVLADECIEIADSAAIDPADKRIRIDTRLRLIGKWNRRDYGDKQDVELSGSVEISMTPEQRQERIKALVSKLGAE